MLNIAHMFGLRFLMGDGAKSISKAARDTFSGCDDCEKSTGESQGRAVYCLLLIFWISEQCQTLTTKCPPPVDWMSLCFKLLTVTQDMMSPPLPLSFLFLLFYRVYQSQSQTATWLAPSPACNQKRCCSLLVLQVPGARLADVSFSESLFWNLITIQLALLLFTRIAVLCCYHITITTT